MDDDVGCRRSGVRMVTTVRAMTGQVSGELWSMGEWCAMMTMMMGGLGATMVSMVCATTMGRVRVCAMGDTVCVSGAGQGCNGGMGDDDDEWVGRVRWDVDMCDVCRDDDGMGCTVRSMSTMTVRLLGCARVRATGRWVRMGGRVMRWVRLCRLCQGSMGMCDDGVCDGAVNGRWYDGDDAMGATGMGGVCRRARARARVMGCRRAGRCGYVWAG